MGGEPLPVIPQVGKGSHESTGISCIPLYGGYPEQGYLAVLTSEITDWIVVEIPDHVVIGLLKRATEVPVRYVVQETFDKV